MAPQSLQDIKLEDIDFEKVKECDDKQVLKRYIKLLEDDGSYFSDLLLAVKERLREVAPKEYYLLYPVGASDQEVLDATKDLLDWEEAVKETDKALKGSKQKDYIWEESLFQARLPIRGQETSVARPNSFRQEQERPRLQDESPSKREVLARDKTKMKDYYSAWDKVDVDAIEDAMDEEERKAEEMRRKHFEDLKEEQDRAQASTPMDLRDPDEVPEAHKRYMADTEKEKGNEAFFSKDFAEAEAYYTRSLYYKADDPSTWANRALVRLKMKKAKGALEDCEHALALNPHHMKALHRKGKALHELERYEEAVKYFQLALAESPGNSQINGDLMVARRKLRNATGEQEDRQPRIVEITDDEPQTFQPRIVEVEEEEEGEEVMLETALRQPAPAAASFLTDLD